MSNNNTPRRIVSRVEAIEIGPHEEVYLQRQGKRFAEVNHFMRKPQATVRRINKYEYEVISSRERRFYEKKEKKLLESMRKAMKKLRGVIRANFGENEELEAHITLTYRENMQDPKRLYEDFKKWYKQLKYHYPKHQFEYIAVAEPQERGAWHIHLLLKSNKPLWMDNQVEDYLNFETVRDMWRKASKDGGSTRHERINQNDVGKYFEQYFSTIIDESIEMSGDKEAIKTASKAAKKGSRLHYYPQGFRFYRCSKGIKRPASEESEYENIIQEYGQPVKKTRYEIVSEMGEILQRIQKERFEVAKDE